eukprot:m.195476 g.195476  ORF g.195476 m.195476 type:complete len:293 (+) comp13667_c2_seq5:1224-2102(+)
MSDVGGILFERDATYIEMHGASESKEQHLAQANIDYEDPRAQPLNEMKTRAITDTNDDVEGGVVYSSEEEDDEDAHEEDNGDDDIVADDNQLQSEGKKEKKLKAVNPKEKAVVGIEGGIQLFSNTDAVTLNDALHKEYKQKKKSTVAPIGQTTEQQQEEEEEEAEVPCSNNDNIFSDDEEGENDGEDENGEENGSVAVPQSPVSNIEMEEGSTTPQKIYLPVRERKAETEEEVKNEEDDEMVVPENAFQQQSPIDEKKIPRSLKLEGAGPKSPVGITQSRLRPRRSTGRKIH